MKSPRPKAKPQSKMAPKSSPRPKSREDGMAEAALKRAMNHSQPPGPDKMAKGGKVRRGGNCK